MTGNKEDWLRMCEAVVLNASDAIVLTEADPIDHPGPRIVFVNEAFSRITGYAPHEVLGKSPRILQGERTQRSELDRIREALERGEPVRAELINYRKDGSEFWTDIYIAPIRDAGGRITHWAAAKRDITERKRVEDALRRTELSNTALLNALPDTVFRLNREGVFLDCKLTRNFDPLAPPEQFLGKNMADVMPPRLARRAAAALQHAFETGEPQVFEYQLRFGEVLKDYEARVVVSCDNEAVALVREITERKRLEEQLRRAQKMQAVGRLAGGVAHDFNNLLTVIEGFAQMLLDLLGESSPVRVEIEEILRAADRAATLTQRLLSFSRHQPAPPTVVRVNAVVADMEKLLRRATGEDIELTTFLRPDAGSIHAQEGQIEQVLMNLVLNSRDAMPAGGQLTIETGAVELAEEYARTHPGVAPGRYVMLAVRDTGQGMDAETRSHLLEPFFTTKEPGRGTGLGLSTVYGIVRQLGGSIDVTSEPEAGTTVRIYLPAVLEEAAPAKAAELRKRRLKGAETVLLVEDEAGVRRLLREILERSGYRVLEARGPTEALETGSEYEGPIGLLLTDVVMPKMSGGELARRMRGQRSGLKVLYISGYADDRSLRRERLETGEAFLQKPFTPEVLLGRLRELLDVDAAAAQPQPPPSAD